MHPEEVSQGNEIPTRDEEEQEVNIKELQHHAEKIQEEHVEEDNTIEQKISLAPSPTSSHNNNEQVVEETEERVGEEIIVMHPEEVSQGNKIPTRDEEEREVNIKELHYHAEKTQEEHVEEDNTIEQKNSLAPFPTSSRDNNEQVVVEVQHITKPVSNTKNDLYTELLNLYNKDLILNEEKFECPVCFTECKSHDGVVLRECLHSFCKECLQSVVKYCEEADVKCPYQNNMYSCDSIILEHEIKCLVDKPTYEKRLEKSLAFAENAMENTFHCKTVNCNGWCFYEDNASVFDCPVCKKQNCLICMVIHENKNCEMYQEEMNIGNTTDRTKKMLEDMVRKKEAMMCPSCKAILMKTAGCDAIVCSICKTDICWVTRGPRWGPLGKGDVSAGCRCKVNGIKCHFLCNNCH